MKHFSWMALIVSIGANSDIEIKASSVAYGLGSYGDFTFKAYQVGYTGFYGDFGLSLLGGQSEKGEGHYMRNFFSMAALYKAALVRKTYMVIGPMYTEYRACHVQWGCNPDTGLGWVAGLAYYVGSGVSIKLTVNDYYRKEHEQLGTERTKSLALSMLIRK
jgi:hypothetical protein